MRLPRQWLLLLVLGYLVPAFASAQGGYDTTKFKELGLEFPVPRDYEQIPTQPDEDWVVLYFAERVPKDKDKRKALRPELNVVWIDMVPDTAPSTPASGPDAPPLPGEGAPDAKSDEGGEDKKPPPPPINSFERYVEQQLTLWKLESPKALEAEKGWQRFEASLVIDSKRGPDARGSAIWFKSPKRTIGFYGICGKEDLEKQQKIWKTIADKLEIGDAENASAEKWQRFYDNKDCLDTAYRAEVRSKLVRGWNADDTKNYILIYDTKDRPLIRLISTELEAMRGEYERLFPAALPVKAVSAVRICKDEAEYKQYGGPPRSGGYWNWIAGELVFFDYENVKGKANTGKANSRIVLYHEAFHQYIHYSCGELSPHSWFNEGTGDYFSGSVISAGKVNRVGVNPWRIETIQEAIRRNLHVEWRKIIRFEQAEYYANPSICYAQGWSMIYFLRSSKAVEKNPQWRKILPVYFDTLKSSWKTEQTALKAAGKLENDKAKAEAQARAREEAVAKAFEGVDLDKIQEAWQEYTLALKVPKD
ncbi:MAG TPA: DUF1570 domain-containing protein [Planctomycetota bacterium]|nr:DUF1570 domain-containing protein [Planctomycetota bacterium]